MEDRVQVKQINTSLHVSRLDRLSWKLRSCPKASHTALLLIADFPFSRGCPKGDRKAYIRASFSSQPIPWTFLSESFSLLNWSLDCSSWRKIPAYPSVSNRCLISTRDFWIGPWTKSPHFFCSSYWLANRSTPCSEKAVIRSTQSDHSSMFACSYQDRSVPTSYLHLHPDASRCSPCLCSNFFLKAQLKRIKI